MTFIYPVLFHKVTDGTDKGGRFIGFPDLPCYATRSHDHADGHAYAVAALTGWLRVGFRHCHPLNRPSDYTTALRRAVGAEGGNK